MKKKRVMKDTVSKQCKHYKVDGGPHARLHSSLRANTVVHHLIPVLSSEDLRKRTHNNTQSNTVFIHKTEQHHGAWLYTAHFLWCWYTHNYISCSVLFAVITWVERNKLSGLFPNLKDSHDSCRKGVEVCRRVVFKDEPVRKMSYLKKQSRALIVFFSQTNQFLSSPAGWLIFFSYALCILKASSYTRHLKWQLVGNSLWLRGEQQATIAVLNLDRTHTVSWYNENNCRYSIKRNWMNHEIYFSLVRVNASLLESQDMCT